jgi:hypothetical protein
MAHRPYADHALRLSDYRFVELHITSSCFLKSNLFSNARERKVALASVPALGFAG